MIGTRAQVVNLPALGRLQQRLGAFVNLDFAPLMRAWERVLTEDNRKGVLEGKDGWDRMAPPLSYRGGSGQRTEARMGTMRGVAVRRHKGRSDYTFNNPEWLKKTAPTRGVVAPKQRGAVQPTARTQRAPADRRGAVILPNNNMSTAAYRRMSGPRLAPRREASRVIANYVTRSGRAGSTWFAQGQWPKTIMDPKGRPFLRYHFDGVGRMPRYDLRHVREWGMQEARRLLVQYVRHHIRRLGGDVPGVSDWRQYRDPRNR
jgi:hypothetical protein